MADHPSTTSNKSKFRSELPQLFRNLIKPSKSNNSASVSLSSSNRGFVSSSAHDFVPGNGADTNATTSYQQGKYTPQDTASPRQSARTPLSTIQHLPASTVGQEGNRENGPGSSSAAERVSENSQMEGSDWKVPVKENLKVVGRFLQTLLKKSPDYVDPNPVKIALSIVKTIIEIKNAVGDNKDGFAQGLRETETILHSLERNVDFSVAKDVEGDVERFKRQVGEEKRNLEELAGKLLITQVLDYEEYKTRIQFIFRRIKVATTSFQVAMTINIHNDLKKVALERLNPSVKADCRTVLQHNANTLKREECTVGTRVKIRNQITEWANDRSSDSARVFWLTGQAGSGKTTIACTISKAFEKDGCANQCTVLGANFFCSRQFQETQSKTRIIPTIAYHLAHTCKSYANALHVADKFDAVDRNVPTQMKGLLVGPWQQSEATRHPGLPSYLIVIDALDEIEDKGGSEFLHCLLLAINKYDLRGLKFLVTSRSDPELVKLCEGFISNAVYRLQDVPIEETKLDIRTYLEDKLPKLAGSLYLAKVVRQAGGLFIYAATVVRYLTTDNSVSAAEQTSMLKDLLSKSDDASKATFLIDVLYRQIMYDTFYKLRGKYLTRRLHILYTFLCTAERTSTSIAAALVADGDNEAAAAVLDNLHAVLYTLDNQVFWYHASFPDFIFDRARSNFRVGEKDFVFSCDEQAHHYRLAQSCFRVMKPLRFNVGKIPSSFLFDHDNVVALSEQVNQNISPVLRYSCGHWAYHLPSLHVIDADILCSYISDFLEIRVLFWIEVMNLIGLHDQCTPILQCARQWVLKWKNSSLKLARDIGEAANFATYFTGSPAAESTPHLYISALATWSRKSSLSRNWKKQFSGIPAFTHTTGDIDLPLMTIPTGSPVTAVAFSGDGTQIVSGSGDWSVRVWDASTGAEQKVLKGHTKEVFSVVFSSDATQIVSGSHDKSVRVWDASTGAELKILMGHTGPVRSVAFSSDGTRIVSGSYDQSVRVWDALMGVELKILKGHTKVVSSVAFSGDGARVVSSSGDKSVRVWDASTGVVQKVLKGHTDWVRSVAFSSDDTQIVSGSLDQTVRVWDVSTGVEQKVLKGHTDWIRSVAFSSDGTQIVSGSDDQSVRVWDASTGAEQKMLKGHTKGVSLVAFSSDGTRIVSGSDDQSVRVWDASMSAKQKVLKGHTNCVRSVAFSSDGTQIVSGSDDQSVRVWDSSTGAEQKVLKGHTNSVCSVAFLSDGMQIVTGSDDQSVQVWDALTGAEQKVPKSHTDWSPPVASSSEGTYIMCRQRPSQSVWVWDVSTGRAELKVLKGHTNQVFSAAFSSDSMQIVSGSDDHSVRVWDASTGVQQKVLKGHTGSVLSVAFSSDSMRIVSGSYDHSVRVWDALTGAAQKVLKGHTNAVYSVAFSGDGTRIVSGSSDQSVRVWDVSTIGYCHSPWHLTEKNWIISLQGQDHLMWVPPSAGLPEPTNILVISRFGQAAVDFSKAKIGNDWVNCYTPT